MQTKKRSKNKLAWVALSAVILAAAGFAAYVLFWPKPAAREPAAILAKAYMEYTVEADGIIESARKSEVYAPSGLRVSVIYVHEGDAVQAGDTLARLDTEALELEIRRAELNIRSAEANMSSEQTALANSVTSARNSLSSAEISLQTAEREYNILLEQEGNETAVTAAAINLDIARRAYENNQLLFELGDISQEMLNQTADMLDKAQISYDDALRSAQDAIDRSRENYEAAQVRHKTAGDTLNDAIARNTDPAAVALELQRVAYSEKLLRLRDASISAPSGGTVTLVNAKEGANASGLMFIIEEANALIVRARVEETGITEISLGTPCRIRPAGREQSLDGVVTLLPSAAERDITGAFAAVIGDDAYFMVEAAITNVQPGVFIGMNAKVTFITESRNSCFAVPNGLLYRDGERRWVVSRSENGDFVEIQVQTGLETRRFTEIISAQLYEGMEIFSQ